jgi:3-oxoacyl-[acyl-carrier-protein] synthase-3
MSDSSAAVGGAPLRSLVGVQIIGTGSYVPERVVTNEDLASLGCDADWIVQRTGIRERRHAPEGVTTSDLAVAAARRCLEAARVEPKDVDLLVLGTMSPDRLLPATATAVQHKLGVNCAAMDVSAACAGFTYALFTAMQFVGTGCSNRALVIGADANSRVIDPSDIKTYPLFGDGAGAVLLAPGSPEQGALAYTLGSDGSGVDLLHRPVGGAERPFRGQGPQDGSWFLQMEGRPVFKWAVRIVAESSRQVLDAAGVEPRQVAWWILHRPMCASSTRLLNRWALTESAWSCTWTATATRRRQAFRWRSTRRFARARSAAAIWW